MREEYNSLSIGQRVQILRIMFQPGTLVDKYIEGTGWDTKLFIDVLLDTGEMVEHYSCYSGFYPKYDKI